jgi:hypothetical protein
MISVMIYNFLKIIVIATVLILQDEPKMEFYPSKIQKPKTKTTKKDTKPIC